MKQFMFNIQQKLSRFMYGRYGNDSFTNFLFVIALILIIVSVFTTPYLDFLGLAILIYGYYRTFSKKIYKRAAENTKYLRIKRKFTGFFGQIKWNIDQRKVYHIYKCPKCKQKIRIPKGKGRISISCPKCHTEFVKKS